MNKIKQNAFYHPDLAFSYQMNYDQLR